MGVIGGRVCPSRREEYTVCLQSCDPRPLVEYFDFPGPVLTIVGGSLQSSSSTTGVFKWSSGSSGKGFTGTLDARTVGSPRHREVRPEPYGPGRPGRVCPSSPKRDLPPVPPRPSPAP